MVPHAHPRLIFHRQRHRPNICILRRTVIPSPATEVMHMHPQDAVRESGVYYLVPDRHGRGKTIVRRPPPPPTSAPLDDDFDAYTQGGTTTRGPATEFDARIRGSDIVGSSSPLDDNLDAFTNTPGPKSGPTLDPEPPNRTRDHIGPRIERGQQSEAGGFENYGEYGQYMNEMDKMFGGTNTDLKLSVSRVGHDRERGQSRQIGRITNTQAGGTGRGTIGPIGKPTRLVGRAADVVGPRAGQTYEVVSRRVLEDGPERTVTISTWREHVAREAGAESEIDVYYVGADDYAADERNGEDAREEYGSNGRQREVTPTRTACENGDRSNPGSSGSRAGPARSSPERRTHTRKTSGQTHRSRTEEIRSEDEDSQRPRSSQSWDYSPRRTRTPESMPRRDVHSPKGKEKVYSRREESPPRSSTPIRRGVSPQQTRGSRGSTPQKTTVQPIPFHPTQSGSTISTIKSASTIAFEQVLSSCEPPLLHISPLLAGLGISTEGHLRAIARLTEETRDREVREEALKQGITVMEWAILLDKLQSL